MYLPHHIYISLTALSSFCGPNNVHANIFIFVMLIGDAAVDVRCIFGLVICASTAA